MGMHVLQKERENETDKGLTITNSLQGITLSWSRAREKTVCKYM